MSDETAKTNNQVPAQPTEAAQELPPPKPSKTPPKKAEQKPAPGRPLPLLGLLALLLAVAAGAWAIFDFLRWQQQTPVITSLTTTVTDQAQQISALENAQRDITASLEQERRQQQEERAAFNTAVEGINAKLGRTTVGWRLAEVEHLLAIANDRLTLDNDRRTALIALTNADSKLQLVDDPGLLSVRKHIHTEVTALNAVDAPDIAGLALTLGGLIETVDHLPLLDRTPVVEEVADTGAAGDTWSWQQILHTVWADLKSLVRVRRHDQPVEPLLPPDEEWYLRHNLRLKLEQARLAMLSRETALFRQSLADTGRWLAAYFDPQATAVTVLTESLESLGRVELAPAWPDISASLRELRDHMRRLDEQLAGAGRKGGGA